MGAFVALTAATRGLPTLPATNLAALVFGIPLVAALVGWIVAGREPDTLTRQAITWPKSWPAVSEKTCPPPDRARPAPRADRSGRCGL